MSFRGAYRLRFGDTPAKRGIAEVSARAIFVARSNLWINLISEWSPRRVPKFSALENYCFLLSFPEFLGKFYKIFTFSNLHVLNPLYHHATGRMTVPAIAALVFSITATVSAATELPSGLEAELHEVLVEQIGAENWTRFRFLAPQIDRTRPDAPAFADLERDFPHLCESLVLPFLKEHDLDADKVVISIADRLFDFGVSDPDATQYFEQFRIENGVCVWEEF